ncbi:hypothetical protein B296_00001734 [Ensete ventricosum]|uniref:Uncharacterized protein n=1 Tax=Ensete ventricosum TaxID=4639 RepID=A0A426ZZY6_ENSVE|nr:hypothetical protein B296_00001734 [Ensete ventricosum]
MHRVDAVGKSPGVRWEFVEGIESLLGWRKGVRKKKTETCRKIVGDNGPRSSLSIWPGFGRCSGISLKFIRRFAEGIGKLAGNMSRDCRKKIEKLIVRMSKAARLVGSSSVKVSAGNSWGGRLADHLFIVISIKG